MIRTINPNEDRFLFMGNGMKSSIEGIGTYHLILESEYVLDLYSTLYVPSLSRNLISVSKLDNSGFRCMFGSGCFDLYKNTDNVGSGILIDGLYKLKLNDTYANSLLNVVNNIG